jgi:hypothetical protein
MFSDSERWRFNSSSGLRNGISRLSSLGLVSVEFRVDVELRVWLSGLKWTQIVRQPKLLIKVSPDRFRCRLRPQLLRRLVQPFYPLPDQYQILCGLWSLWRRRAFPRSELVWEAEEAQPVGNGDRPPIHRPSW